MIKFEGHKIRRFPSFQIDQKQSKEKKLQKISKIKIDPIFIEGVNGSFK